MTQAIPQTQGKDYVLVPMPDEMIPWCAHCRDHTEFQSWYAAENNDGKQVLKHECLICEKPMHKPCSGRMVGPLFAASFGVLFVLFLIDNVGWQPLCLLAIMTIFTTFLIWRWHCRGFYYEWKKWSEELLKDPNNKFMVIGNKTVIAKGQSTPPT